jgi:hypothetical protein
MQKVMSAIWPLVQPIREIVHNANSASMVVDDGGTESRGVASPSPLGDNVIGSRDNSIEAGRYNQIAPLALEFARTDYHAFNPRPIRAGSFGQPYSGESSPPSRPVHVGNTILVPILFSETLEQDNLGSRSVGVLQDFVIPSRMTHQNHTQPVVHTGIVHDGVDSSQVIPHPQM